jgi:hypothetical protein
MYLQDDIESLSFSFFLDLAENGKSWKTKFQQRLI